ncbi:hypothetical protein CR513_46604, partial [Mucuna pruriens]
MVKCFHDNMILRKEFKVGQKMLLFNSRLKLIAVEIRHKAIDKTFKVNGHQLKLFHKCPTMMEGDVEDLSLVKPTLLENLIEFFMVLKGDPNLGRIIWYQSQISASTLHEIHFGHTILGYLFGIWRFLPQQQY